MRANRSLAAVVLALVGVLIAVGCTTGGGTGSGGSAATTTPTGPTTAPGPTTSWVSQPGPQCPPTSGVQQHNGDLGINCDLRALTLDNIDIAGSYGPELHLDNATITNSSLAGGNWKYSVATGVQLTNVDISGAGFPSTAFNNSVWNTVNATGAHLQSASGYPTTDFSGAFLVDVDFTGADLSGSVWTGASLTNVILSASTICPDGLNFTGADKCRGSLPGY